MSSIYERFDVCHTAINTPDESIAQWTVLPVRQYLDDVADSRVWCIEANDGVVVRKLHTIQVRLVKGEVNLHQTDLLSVRIGRYTYECSLGAPFLHLANVSLLDRQA